MTAYSRVEMWDLEFFEVLEKVFIDKIEEATGESIVTMFVSHSNWAAHMIDQCLVKKA